MLTVGHLNLRVCNLHCLQPVWQIGVVDPLIIIKATTKAKLLTRRYPFTIAEPWEYTTATPAHCVQILQTLNHFLPDCPILQGARKSHMDKLLATMTSFHLPAPVTDDKAMRLIIHAPSSVCISGYLKAKIDLK